jgi:hypothetical protein
MPRRYNSEKFHRTPEYWELQRYKVSAIRAVAKEVTAGRMPPVHTLKCSNCGVKALVYHHHKGYEKEFWLDVIPLCGTCHKESHIE